MNIKQLLLIILIVLFMVTVYADKVILKSGREIIGTISSTAGDSVVIIDSDNIQYRILKSDIREIELGDSRKIQQTQEAEKVTGPDNQSQKPIVSYDQEDNNSFSKANYIKIGSSDSLSFNGRLFPKGDRDIYYFTVEKAGQYKIKIIGKSPLSCPGLWIDDGNNSTISSWTWAEVVNPQVEYKIDQGYLNIGDKIYFEIGQKDDDRAMDYTVQLSVTVISDNYEPNNEFKEAKEIESSGEFQGFIFPEGDSDYYKLDIPEAGRLNVSYSHNDVNMWPNMRLLSAENDTLIGWTYAEDVGKMTKLSYDFASADKVYLTLDVHGTDRGSLLPYLLKTEFLPVKDIHEPNNGFSEAKMIPVGQTTSAYFFPKGDRDFYRFVVDQPGLLTVKITTKDALTRPSVKLYDGNISGVTNWQNAEENSNEVGFSREVLPGTYFLQVADDADHNSMTDYQLNLSLAPSNDSYEPNDSFAKAKVIGIGTPINATIFPKGDYDYYKVLISQPCDLTVDITTNAVVIMEVKMYDGNNSGFTNWNNASDYGKELKLTESIKEPGWYCIAVATENRGSTKPYLLILTTD